MRIEGPAMMAVGLVVLWQRKRLVDSTTRSRVRSEQMMSGLVRPKGEARQRQVAKFSVPAAGLLLLVGGILVLLGVVGVKGA